MCSTIVKARLSVQEWLECRDKLAQAEKQVETMTAAMRSANPLTPFDLPMTPSSTRLSFASQCPTYSQSLHDAEGAAMQPIPAAHLPHFQNVEMVISSGALGGWVEQASPACGAASVAGAWNAIKPEGKEPFILSSKLKTFDNFTLWGGATASSDGSIAAAQQLLPPCISGAARASKEDVLLMYANKWQQHIKQSCATLAQFLQVPDAAPLHAAIQAAWPFTDQVLSAPFTSAPFKET